MPVPFSVFPSSYRETPEQQTTTTHTHEEIDLNLPQRAGREGQYSSFQATAHRPRRGERYSEEEVRITREEEHRHRPGVHHEYYREEHRPRSDFHDTRIEFDHTHRPYQSAVDIAEREYRSRVQPTYREEIRETGSTVDPPQPRSVFHEDVKITEETVEAPRYDPTYQKSRMGYYDDHGEHHSFRHGLHKMADRLVHPEGHEKIEITEIRESRGGGHRPHHVPNTVTIPCHHIRLGDILILQGRPCQVIRISTSAATGQHRYLGVDLFTKQLHEESSSISSPGPSVVVQTMLGPILKQYRVLDIQEDTIVAMTETGDVKQALSVIDQSNLWERLSRAFESGRGSLRVLVVNDHGRELVVDMKVIHGARL